MAVIIHSAPPETPGPVRPVESPERAEDRLEPRSRKTSGSTSVRTVLRLHPDVRQQVEYWADSHGISANEYMTNAVEDAIRRENQDYDLPTLEIRRLNQLIDEIRALALNSANLERVVTSGFDSLIGLTRGDNYLLDEEDGEI